MPDPNPAALDFLLTRRSRPAKTLGLPVPDRAALEPILQAGLRSPDHGKLEPWRLLVLEGAALMRLAQLVPDRGLALQKTPEEIAKQVKQYADAMLAVAVIACPAPSPKVPEREQALSAGAVCLQLLNAALAAGWGANWLSGWASHDPVFARDGLGLADGEWIAGFIHMGTETSAPPERPRPDMDAKVSWISA
ncbi:nitroreductase family protein [Maribius pontilimi]|uniref:Putative NAD(P)H nitroreductase n=1 Tax=Palleronia pontilimi TaxID=1964209 RepID=A0A934MCD8_9RHOB|nr:nitroreductase family protein [Palleronia pontilimi]MBJ3762678.1 nitroreductase family protein [Palleronia pontilimi]